MAIAVRVQNTSTILGVQAAEAAMVIGPGVAVTIVESGEETGPTVSVCRVVGVGEISGTTLAV